MRFNTATKRLHFGAHHIHANTTARHACDLLRRRKAGHEDQLGCACGIHHLISSDQPLCQGLVADTLHIQACAVIVEAHRYVIAFLLHLHADGAAGRLARCGAQLGLFNTVVHAVAQQMLKRRHHALEHATVHFNGATRQAQLDLLAGFLGRAAHHGIQTLRDSVELHHARAQQVTLQLTGLTALGNQIVFRRVHIPLQTALHRGHVVDRLGHHARELLHTRETVKLERVKVCTGFLGQLHARLHL